MSGGVQLEQSGGGITPLGGVDDAAKTYEAGSYKGLYPENWGLAFLGAIGTNTGDILYTSPDVSMYNVHEFQGVTSGVFTVEVSLDGTNFSGAVFMADQMVANPDGAKVGVSANLTSIYIVRGKYAAVRAKQSGATAANVRGRHAVG